MTSVQASDVVRSYLDAWLAGDLGAVLEHYHPDLELVWPGSHPLAGHHVGGEASLGVLLRLGELTARVPVKVTGIFDGPGSVIASVIERWSDGDQVMELSRALQFEVVDGLLRSCTVFDAEPDKVDEWISHRTGEDAAANG